MSFKPRLHLPSTATTLPARFYTDATIFAREQEVFFRRSWVGVGRLEAIGARGSWMTREIAGDSIIVLRASEAGDVRAFHNVCRHRGTRLCAEPSGTFAGRITCPYHAWTYDYDGTLAGAPHMEGTTAFSKADYPLRGVRADVWDGHVFVSLRPDGPSLDAHLGDLRSKFRRWGMADLRVAAERTYDVQANWKLVIQNYNECLHCPTLHPALNRLSHYLSGENEPIHATYMGGRMDLNDDVETMSVDGKTRRRALPNLEPADRRRVYYYSLFPNFLVAPHPDYVLTHTLWPIAPNCTRVICDWLVHPGEGLPADVEVDDVTAFWDATNRQDWHICELAQAGISSPAYVPGPYSSREDLLYAFDRFVVAALGDI
jgi:Rieske 2Fe-2S family protein